MNTVTANELKTKGLSVIEAQLEKHEEVLISVRGQDKYVVMDIEKYSELRECELEVALLKAKADIDAGNYTTGTVADHIKGIADEL
ncbi:MAG: type II toxin-antitoxin system Phd/YefM family antitoxin [Pseudomonadota bacterium]